MWYFRNGVSIAGGSLGRATQPFVALYTHLRYQVSPGEDLSFEFGVTTDVVGSYDKIHLTSAHMDGATVEMNDVDLQTGEVTPTGETVTLGPFTWTAATSTYRSGNDGPDLDELMPPNVRDRCHTTVSQAHQKLTRAYVTGTVDGVPISTYYGESADTTELPGAPEDAHGAIFNSWFRLVDVAHGGKNCL